MARKTDISNEVSERIDYFEDFFEKLSKTKAVNSDDVVDDKSAIDYLKELARRDGSLENLTDELSRTRDGFRKLIDTDFIQELILKNKIRIREYEDSLKDKYARKGIKKSQDDLDKAVARLRKKRLSLEKGMPSRSAVKRRNKIVISAVMTERFLNKYGYKKVVQKNGVSSYRDMKGRFVKNDVLLRIADKVLIASKSKRLEVDKLLKKDALGRTKKS